MATSFRKTAIKAYPRVGEKATRDTIYWKNLDFPVTRKEFGAISHIDFCPTAPHNFAVTSATKVQIFSPEDNQVVKKFSRFRDGATCGHFRPDGKLLVTGSKEGAVRMYEVTNKALLRVFKGHQQPSHVARFLTDQVRILTASDDQTASIWDIAAEQAVVTYKEHQDYIRCGVASQASKDIVLTGSYDHTVKLFDARCPTSTLTVNHGSPVESVIMMPSGGLFLSAGGTVIKVWDALAGGKLVTSFSNHHKTITCLAFCSDYQRLLSASLDRHVKIYDVTTYQVVHTLDYPSAVLSVGVSADDSVVAAGMVDGLLSVQHRKEGDENDPKVNQKKKASYRYSVRGKVHVPTQDDLIVEHKRKEQLSKYDKLFKKFENSKALDAALDIRVRMRTPEVTVSVLLELIRRGGVRAALAGRDEKSLTAIIRFIQKNLSNPRYMSTLIDVSSILIEIYGEQLGQSAVVDELLGRLKDTVDQEASYMRSLMEIMGSMDTLFAASERDDMTSTSSTTDGVVTLTPSSAAIHEPS